MTKIQANELRSRQRYNLWEVVPLDTPFLVYLEPTNWCNQACTYCPTGHEELRAKRPNGIMDWDLFLKIAQDLRGFPHKIRMINLYKDGEPLLNPRFTDMVSTLKEYGVAEKIWSKTNGLKLGPEINKKLATCGLDMLGISIVDVNASGYKKNAGVTVDIMRLVDNIRDLYNQRGKMKIYISIRDMNFTEAEKVQFYETYEDCCDSMAIEGLHGWSDSSVMDFRLGTDNSFDGTPIQDKIVCPLTLCSLGINWNGTVGPCNEDWQHAALVGDAKTESLLDIWHGRRMYAFRMMHLQNKRSENISCRDCHYLACLPDNVDLHRFEIMERI